MARRKKTPTVTTVDIAKAMNNASAAEANTARSVVAVSDTFTELVALRNFYDAVAKQVTSPPMWTEQMRQSLHEISRLVAAHPKTFIKSDPVVTVASEPVRTTTESTVIQNTQITANEATDVDENETQDTTAEDFPADPEEDAAEAAEAERS